MEVLQSRNIYDYTLVLEGLFEEFGFFFHNSMLKWCRVIRDNVNPYYWQVYLIKEDNEYIGVCGLYSLYPTNEQLWLGWFGIVPSYRNKDIGGKALEWMKTEARSIGGKKLMSYVDSNGKALNFYYRHGFKNLGTVKDYLKSHPDLSMHCFENENDYVIEYNL